MLSTLKYRTKHLSFCIFKVLYSPLQVILFIHATNYNDKRLSFKLKLKLIPCSRSYIHKTKNSVKMLDKFLIFLLKVTATAFVIVIVIVFFCSVLIVHFVKWKKMRKKRHQSSSSSNSRSGRCCL